jgi:hypothetical protein
MEIRRSRTWYIPNGCSLPNISRHIWGPELTVEEHRLDGKPTTDMIQANHTLETIIESLVKEFPELDEHRNRIFNCLSIGLKNAEPSKNDNS